MNRLLHAEMDRDYYKSIIEGTWPDADKVIAAARAKFPCKVSVYSSRVCQLGTQGCDFDHDRIPKAVG